VVEDPAHAALVLGVVVESITHATVTLHPESLADQRSVDDVTRMLTAYLTGRTTQSPQSS
jgi:hypothetical protein